MVSIEGSHRTKDAVLASQPKARVTLALLGMPRVPGLRFCPAEGADRVLGIACVDTRNFYVATRPCPGLGAATEGPQTPGALQGPLEPTVEALTRHCGHRKTCIITEVALEARVSCTTTREAMSSNVHA